MRGARDDASNHRIFLRDDQAQQGDRLRFRFSTQDPILLVARRARERAACLAVSPGGHHEAGLVLGTSPGSASCEAAADPQGAPPQQGTDSPAERRGFEPSVTRSIDDALETALFASAAPPIPPERPTRFRERDRQFRIPVPFKAVILNPAVG